MKNISIILIAFLSIIACKGKHETEFDIHGVWTLECIHIPEGSDYIYAERTNVIPVKAFTDDAYYVGYKMSEPGRLSLAPSYSGKYKLVNKGGGEWLYFEDGNQHKLSVVNDSTINIEDVGRIYEWHKMDGSKDANVGDILSIAEQDKEKWDDDNTSYVFSERERSLESDRQNLAVVILCIVLAFALFIYYTHNVLREKARIEQQLKQIQKDIEERPKAIQEALMNVEDEFLNSEFYLSIRKRIANGEHLKKADWDEIERQVNSTYPGFTGRLFNLFPMSQIEMQTCLLIKMRASTTEIANTLNKSTSAISSIRSRLYGKVFHDKRGAKEWDEFILSL